MAGNWGINTLLALLASLITYFSSFMNNTWQTSMLRAIIGFLLFFLFGYILRVVLHQTISKERLDSIQSERAPEVDAPERTETVQEDEPAFQSIPLDSLHIGGDATDIDNRRDSR